MELELELGLALPNNGPIPTRGFDLNDDCTKYSCQKRAFDEAFGMITKTTTLPLFVHDDDNGKKGSELDYMNPHHPIMKVRELVGWPPIKCTRKNIAFIEEEGLRCDNGSSGARKGKWVKVKMEGVGIGRKLDISLHNSYQSLLYTLTQMFPKQLDEETVTMATDQGERNYTVKYKDEDGDWLLVADVPWQSFIQSVKHLKILG